MFSKRLKTIRNAHKVSQSATAEAIGKTLRTYQKYESGEIEPTLNAIEGLADYFDVPLDCLVGRGLFAKEELIEQNMELIIKFLSQISFTDSDANKQNHINSLYGMFINLLKSDLPLYEKIQHMSFFVSDIEVVDSTVTIRLKLK